MSLIPFGAFRFGAESININPIRFSKSRISGSQKFSYIMHSKAACMPGQKNIFTATSASQPGLESAVESNQVIEAFKRQACSKLHIAIGPRDHGTSPFGFTFDQNSPNDDEALNVAIRASYRQIYGNYHAMESERPYELERRLRNGDFTIREFVRQLAKSDFYLEHYFYSVSQQRAIELNFKHLLGRPPNDQSEIVRHIKIISHEGFSRQVDTLIDSPEYQEVFGDDIVPYIRSWNSPCGLTTSSFNKTCSLTRSFATSDNVIHSREFNDDSCKGRSQLLYNLAQGINQKILIPSWP